MTDQRRTILKRLEPSGESSIIKKTKAWLLSADTEPLTEKAIEVKVGDVKKLWSVRLGISQSKGHTVEGAPELLKKLEELNSRVKLEQIGFFSSGVMGNIFFRKTTQEYVGTVLFAASRARD